MKTLIDCQNCQLKDCQKNCKLKVIKLHAPTDLKQRLISFGIMKGSIIEILEHSPAKSTMEIKVGKMRIALRAKEAALIEVEKI
ncbi:FeoA family protein [Sulfurimonas sp.]|jgi:ferrous iron transport protein A|uniref:FeoA family protein n=1 Tax=Sulfurimonas sp. TaxID=2022749 RepID=UPI0025E15328|nr:FeoA family protein [Sulfurimonas sp.]